MGNITPEILKFERLVDNELNITIGIVSHDNSSNPYSSNPYSSNPYSSNPYSSQAIKIGDNSDLLRLTNFIETSNSLVFEYHDDTTLSFTKRNSNIILHIKYPRSERVNNYTTSITKVMNKIIRNSFKSIGFGELSLEYDKLHEFIKLDSSKINETISNETISNEIITD